MPPGPPVARLPWNHADLLRAEDPSFLRPYRLLQSWYRENVLDADYDTYRGKPVGSRLSEAAVAERPNLNFYSVEVAQFAEQEAQRVKKEGGTLEVERLRRNMLSSMPLCFNIFGALREHPELPRLLRETLDVPVHEISDVRCEWAPPKAQALDDRTAFDAFVSYRSPDGSSGFLGIETKYTEPFSPKVYDNSTYRNRTDSSGWFEHGAAEALSQKLTNQLWRNVLLATTLVGSGEYSDGWSVVLTLRDDERAQKAKGVLEANLTSEAKVRWASYEDLVDQADAIPSLADWASWFRERYLDLAPIKASIG